MKKVIDRLILAGRIGVVIVALLALVVSGAEAAERLYSAADTPEQENLPEAAGLHHNPAPEDATDQMAPDGRPCTEQAAYFQASVGLPTGSDQQRENFVAGAQFDVDQQAGLAARHFDEPATTSQVDSRVGHRFTLVGAKPSGTS